MADVFISYSRKDRPLALRLATALEAQGISVWMDNQIAGGSTFTDVTEAELNQAGKVIVLWSSNSIASNWVKDEAQIGREQGKLIPLTIDGSQPPIGFRQIQTLDIVDWAKGSSTKIPEELEHALASKGHAPNPQVVAAAPVTSNRRNFVIAAIVAAILLLGAAYWLMAPSSTNSGGSEVRVTVMPLEAVGNAPEDEALAAGITEELINRLRRIPDLQAATGDANEEPNGNALRGSVRRDGQQLRVSARLQDASGNVLWSDNFDRQLTDLLNVQEEIAAAVARSLSVSLDVGVDSREYGGTDNPEAFASYLQGRINLVAVSEDERTRYFERAVELDPDYIRAWAGLSSAYALNLFPLVDREEIAGLIEKSNQASTRAFEANPELFWGNTARAQYFITTRDLVEAESYIERAKRLDPGNDPEIKFSLAGIEVMMGRLKNADRLELAAEQIDPVYAKSDPVRVRDLVLMGRYQEALDLYEEFRRENHPSNVYNVIHVYWAKRFLEDKGAAEQFAQAVGLEGFVEFLQTYDAAVAGGMLELSEDELRNPSIPRRDQVGVGANLGVSAQHAAADGHPDAALRFIRVMFETNRALTLYYLWHPSLADLRSTRGYHDIIEDLGFDDAWRESGNWGDFCRPISDSDFECF